MNYYQILGVSRTATSEEIQSAYHKLALKYHPDANRDNPEAAEKIKDVNRAYQALRRPDKRKEYDETLAGAAPPTRTPGGKKPTGTQSPQNPIATPRPSPGPGNPLADILGTLYGGAQANGGAQAASNTSENDASNIPIVEIPLTPREATTGAIKTIRVNGRLLRIKISIQR